MINNVASLYWVNMLYWFNIGWNISYLINYFQSQIWGQTTLISFRWLVLTLRDPKGLLGTLKIFNLPLGMRSEKWENRKTWSRSRVEKGAVIFHQRLSSIKGHIPSKVVFYQRSSFIKSCLLLLYQMCSRMAEALF